MEMYCIKKCHADGKACNFLVVYCMCLYAANNIVLKSNTKEELCTKSWIISIILLFNQWNSFKETTITTPRNVSHCIWCHIVHAKWSSESGQLKMI